VRIPAVHIELGKPCYVGDPLILNPGEDERKRNRFFENPPASPY
jgi:hypothetical protein